MQAALLVACTAAAAVSASASTHNAWAENTSTNDAGHKIRQSPKNIEPRTLWYFVRAAKSVLSLMAGAVVKNKAAQNAPLLFVLCAKTILFATFCKSLRCRVHNGANRNETKAVIESSTNTST